MGLTPAPSPSSRGARPERQALVVFVPAENLRRVCAVPLELLAAMLLLLGIAVRPRPTESPSAGQEQRRTAASRAASQRSESSPSRSAQSSPAESADLQAVERQPELGARDENFSAATSDTTYISLHHKNESDSSHQCSVAGCSAGITDEKASSVPDERQNQDRRDAACSPPHTPDGSETEKDNSDCNDDASSEEETPIEYGPFWPCSVHPPDQPLRFCDLTEEEQEEIMDADLEAYRKAWRPGDMKYVRWNPDPDVADEDQGKEAFHDENYEFFWWTPTAYRATEARFVFFPGNVTKYPVHTAVYCPACDRHVWEALPKRWERLSSKLQPGPGQTFLQENDNQSATASESSAALSPQSRDAGQQSWNAQLVESPVSSLPEKQGIAEEGHPSELSGQDDSLPILLKTKHKERPAMSGYEFLYYPNTSDHGVTPIFRTGEVDHSQTDLHGDQDVVSGPVCGGISATHARVVGYLADKAMQTDPDESGVIECQNAAVQQVNEARETCDLETVGADDIRVKSESLRVAKMRPCGPSEIGEEFEERSVDADCLEHRLLELLKNAGDVESFIGFGHQALADESSHTNTDSVMAHYAGQEENVCSEQHFDDFAVDIKDGQVERSNEAGSKSKLCQGDLQPALCANPSAGNADSSAGISSLASHQDAQQAKKSQSQKGSSRKRKNRKARRLNQARQDALVKLDSGPGRNCGCKCISCKGCSKDEQRGPVGASQQAVPGEVAATVEQHPSVSVPQPSPYDNKTCDATVDPGEELPRFSNPQGVAAEAEGEETQNASYSGPTRDYIDISFGACQPTRVSRQMQVETPLSNRLSYEPQERVNIMGMDFILSDGCIDRLVASGLTFDDFVIPVKAGKRTKNLFVWPGSPTKPCVDLVHNQSHQNSSGIVAAANPETIRVAVDDQITKSNRTEVTVEGKGQSLNASQAVISGGHYERSDSVDCESLRGGMEELGNGLTKTGKRNLSEDSKAENHYSRKESQEETTDIEPNSTDSAEERGRLRNKSKKRLRVAKKIRKKELSSDPSSPFSTLESGSFSSDEDQERELHLTEAESRCLATNEQQAATESDKNQRKACNLDNMQTLANDDETGHVEHQAPVLDVLSPEDQLIHKARIMETRRRLREVRRAKRTAQLLRQVRCNYLHKAKAMRARRVLRPSSTSRVLRVNGIRRAFSTSTGHQDVPKDTVSTSRARCSSQLSSSSTFGSTLASASPEHPTSSACDMEKHHAKVSVNNGNIIEVYNTMAQIAEDTLVREVEIELHPKPSPATVSHDVCETETSCGQKTVEREGPSPEIRAAQHVDSHEEGFRNVPLSPHSKSDGLWNGRCQGDTSELSDSSVDLEPYDLVEATGEQHDTAKRVACENSGISDSLSIQSILEEDDFPREFEKSALGELINLGEELEELEQEASENVHLQTPEFAQVCVEQDQNTASTYDVRNSPSGKENECRLPPLVTNRSLEALEWDPMWMRPPPLSPRSRLYVIFSKAPGGKDSPEAQPDLLPGASENPPAECLHEHSDPNSSSSIGFLRPSEGRLSQLAGLNPNQLITSAYLQPEDDQLAHGDPARPWVRRHSSVEIKTLADAIKIRRMRQMPGIRGVRPPLPPFTHASYSI
ncbi:uncharacterized protein LOC122387881 [Amphibalanus amphitrite]|uniref:uncharacterized protein LOC122387881 n=1 Tax=Amphibalanus amphitrite TaxID=1232801 RepID=UPI001C8FEED8|nr:uncharacterized protein LOC122387881 [Amphibalanus amphitrite]